jgi:hypothetical protein
MVGIDDTVPADARAIFGVWVDGKKARTRA